MGHDVEFIYNGREIPPLTFSMYVKKSISKIARKILSESMLILLKERLGKRTRGKKVALMTLLFFNCQIIGCYIG